MPEQPSRASIVPCPHQPGGICDPVKAEFAFLHDGQKQIMAQIERLWVEYRTTRDVLLETKLRVDSHEKAGGIGEVPRRLTVVEENLAATKELLQQFREAINNHLLNKQEEVERLIKAENNIMAAKETIAMLHDEISKRLDQDKQSQRWMVTTVIAVIAMLGSSIWQEFKPNPDSAKIQLLERSVEHLISTMENTPGHRP